MAAIAIPIVVLGSLYILSEQEKNQRNTINKEYNKVLQENFYSCENKESLDNKKINNNTNNRENFSNYETRKLDDFASQEANLVNSYTNSNQHTDKFFYSQNNINSNNFQNVNLMSGQNIDLNNFRHNNMQPYFGAKIRGATSDLNNVESILDNKQGYGSQSFSKTESAPLFKPDENVNLVNGTANNSDFFQSRMNESMKMNNYTLWDQQRVGPGLNQGYGTQDKNGFNTGGIDGAGGFNAGMTSRETWMPKNVDQLRVDNNPKMTFDLNGHQGPALNPISTISNQQTQGKVEKHLPEKFFESGSNRWFTTTGIEQAPPIRSTQVIPMENRIDTTREYYGAGSQAGTTYTSAEVENSKKQSLGALPITNAAAHGQNSANENDYNINSYNILPNNRTTDKNKMEMGGVYGMAKAAITPILDILKPTRKENVIGNLRQTGNVNGLNPGVHVFNPNDKTKTTNREIYTDKIGLNHVNVQSQSHRGDAYQVTQHQNYDNQRTSTNKEYIGNVGAGNRGSKPYDAVLKQRNNVNKTYELHPNSGNMSLFNNNTNIEINRDQNILNNNRSNIINGNVGVIPSSEFIGEMNGIQTYDQNFNNSRMDPSLLNAFKNNPYTKSLNSVA